jgi:PAS domain S-box-containing protein
MRILQSGKPSSTGAAVNPEKKVTVLYIDDNLYDQELVRHALEEEDGGFRLISATTQAQFEHKLKHEQFDIVLSDFNILGFEGSQIIELVKASQPEMAVIILTGTGSEEIAVKATKSGAADYVIKTPSHIQRLPFTIRTALEQQQLARQKAQVERSLDESHRRLKALFNHTLDALVLMDDEGHFIDANPAACRLFGYSLEEMLGLDAYEIIPENSRELRTQFFDELLELGQKSGHFDVVCKDRAICWVEYNAVANILPGVHLFALRDISARLDAERKLVYARDYYLTLFHYFPTLIWRSGLDGLTDYLNHTWLAFTGRSLEQEMGTGWLDGVHPDDRSRVLGDYQLAFSRRQPLEMEYRLRRYDGEYRWIADFGRPYHDLDGNFAGFIGSCFDVSEQKRQQQELERAEMELKRTYAKERELRELAEVLRDISNLLNLRLDVQQALDKLLGVIARVVPFQSGEIFQVKDGQAHVSHLYGYERILPPEKLPVLLDVTFNIGTTRNLREIVEQGLPSMIISDVAQYEGWVNPMGLEHIRSWIGAPVFIHDQLIAIFSLEHSKPSFFLPRHAELLEAVANQTALALENVRLYNDVLTGRQRLQELSNQLVEVQEIERRQIAQELHDEIGQALTGLKLVMKSEQPRPTGILKDNLEEANRLVGDLLSRVREMSLNLRPAMLDDLGLLPALLWQFDRMHRQADVEIAFQHKGILDQRFDTKIETAAYRIIQEGLTNFVRHAGTKRVSISIIVSEGIMRLNIQDEGVGFDLERANAGKKTTGLTSMQERVALLGGKMDMRTQPGEGTQILAWIPLDGWMERRNRER